MLKLLALTLAIWLVIAATQSDSMLFGGKAKSALKELLGEKKLTIGEIQDKIQTIMKHDRMKWIVIVPEPSGRNPFTVHELYHLTNNEYVCPRELLSRFEEYSKQAKNYPNLKDYLDNGYKAKLEECEDAVLNDKREIQKSMPGEWKILEEFCIAIKSNDRLYADLEAEVDGKEMKEEMMSALGDVLKARSPHVEDDYQRKALEMIRDACKKIKIEWYANERIEVLSKLSSRLGREDELTDYIRYHRLCKLAAATRAKTERKISVADLVLDIGRKYGGYTNVPV